MNDDDAMSDAVKAGIKELFSTEHPFGLYMSTMYAFMCADGDDAAKKEEHLARVMSDCRENGVSAEIATALCQLLAEAVNDHHRQKERDGICLRTN